jgi:hypothetical protein
VNEMELLREAAGDTPLPALSELDAARARLSAAIAADLAMSDQAASDLAMSAPAVPTGAADQPAGPPPPAPGPVLAAVNLMYGGAIGTAAQFIIALAYLGDVNAYHLTVLGHHLTTAQVTQLHPLIATLVVVFGLVLIALWLLLARAVGRGRNWARIASTVLFGLATLELTGLHGVAALLWAMLTWLTGLVVVWQLWRPASRTFFGHGRQAALTRRP